MPISKSRTKTVGRSAVSDEIEQIAAANEEQTARVNEINESVQQLTNTAGE